MSETTQTLSISAPFPPKLIHPLLEATNRYIVLYGGRGAGKSWAVARALLIRAVQAPLRILCVREFMSSIKNSVHKLLCDQIYALGLQDHFVIEKSAIYGKNGSEFGFAGIRSNVDALKSFEGCDICYVAEGQNVTKRSWEVLIPTIRKPNSQIIVDFNPELAEDETYKRFVTHPPPNALVTKINFNENPFFPLVLEEERLFMEQSDPDAYQNVWLGFPKVYLDNAIYGKELRTAQEDGRICHVPYDPTTPVHTFWDLGWAENTSIIMAQQVGFEYHVIDYITDTKTSTIEYLAMLQRKPYVWGIDYLPHDATAIEKGSGRSIEEILRSNGRKVKIVPKLSINDGLNAARIMWPRVYIDEKKCEELVQSLRKYVWDLPTIDDAARQPKYRRPMPLHDGASHGADAWRYMAISLRENAKPFEYKKYQPVSQPGGWML